MTVMIDDDSGNTYCISHSIRPIMVRKCQNVFSPVVKLELKTLSSRGLENCCKP